MADYRGSDRSVRRRALKGARMARALLALFFAVLLGCPVEEIVLVASDAGVGAGDIEGRICTRSEDCDVAEYCEMPDCGGAVGVCRVPPILCNAEASPVCGCDGVTYFNDCWRQKLRVPAKTADDACLVDAQRCGAGAAAPCPAGAFCAKLFTSTAGAGIFSLGGFSELPGSCWVVPPDCGPELGGDRWVSSAEDCTDLCSAVRSEVPHAKRGVRACGP